MSGRQTSNKQNSGRGVPHSGRIPNNGRGNGQIRPPSTPTITQKPSNGHHSTTSVPALVNDLLGRTPTTSTTSSHQTSRVPATTGTNSMTSEQSRVQAEAALKSMEDTNRQTEIRRKAQNDAQLAQETYDNVLPENHDFTYMPDAYFNITSRDGFTFTKAMSPSFGGRSQVLMVDDLVCSPKLVMDPLSTAVISNHSNPVATSNMDRESLEYFILSNSRRHSAVHRPCVPGEIPWLKSPANERGYAQYQDIDHTTPYGRLTLEMCAIAQVDYNYYYRQATSLSSYHIPQTSLLPNPNAESEYVKTNHIFSHWVDGILTQFQTRYPRIFDCLLKPDPFNNQSVREL
jgi:hypothetical protein